MNYSMKYKLLLKPGPASSEGDHPPTNPAIRVGFPLKQMNISFSPWQKNVRPQSIRNISLREEIRKRYLLDKKESGIYILPLHERERSPINWSYDL